MKPQLPGAQCPAGEMARKQEPKAFLTRCLSPSFALLFLRWFAWYEGLNAGSYTVLHPSPLCVLNQELPKLSRVTVNSLFSSVRS